MADLSALNAAVAQVSTDVGEAITALHELSAKVAAGDPIAQADVDAITAQLDGLGDQLDAAVAQDNPPTDGPTDPPTDPAQP